MCGAGSSKGCEASPLWATPRSLGETRPSEPSCRKAAWRAARSARWAAGLSLCTRPAGGGRAGVRPGGNQLAAGKTPTGAARADRLLLAAFS